MYKTWTPSNIVLSKISFDEKWMKNEWEEFKKFWNQNITSKKSFWTESDNGDVTFHFHNNIHDNVINDVWFKNQDMKQQKEYSPRVSTFIEISQKIDD